MVSRENYPSEGFLVTTSEYAKTVNRTSQTIMRWKRDGYGPLPVKEAGRTYLYDRREVESFRDKLRELMRGRWQGKI